MERIMEAARKVALEGLLMAHRAKVILDTDNKFYKRHHLHLDPLTPTLEKKAVWTNVEVYEVTERTVVRTRRDPNYSPVVESIAEPGDVIILFKGTGDHKIVKPPQQKYIVDTPPSGPPPVAV